MYVPFLAVLLHGLLTVGITSATFLPPVSEEPTINVATPEDGAGSWNAASRESFAQAAREFFQTKTTLKLARWMDEKFPDNNKVYIESPSISYQEITGMFQVFLDEAVREKEAQTRKRLDQDPADYGIVNVPDAIKNNREVIELLMAQSYNFYELETALAGWAERGLVGEVTAEQLFWQPDFMGWVGGMVMRIMVPPNC